MPRLMGCKRCWKEAYHIYLNEGGEIEYVICAKEFGGCGYKLSDAELDKLKGTFDIIALRRIDYDPSDMIGG